MSSSYPPLIDPIDFTKVIKLKVGQPGNQEDFYAYPSILASRSQFFKAALQDCWKEGFTGEICLPEDDPQVVHHYLYYAQTSQTPLSLLWLPCPPTSPSSIPSNKRSAHHLLTHLLTLYIFADKLQDPTTKSAILHRLYKLQAYYQVNYHALFPDEDQVWMVYENTVKGDEVRRFVVDVFAGRAEEGGENAIERVCGGEMPGEFWVELGGRLVGLRGEGVGEGGLLGEEEEEEQYVRGLSGTAEESVAGSVAESVDEMVDAGGSETRGHRRRGVWREWCRVLQRAKARSVRLARKLKPRS